jgi:hypothetical protein
MSLQSVQSIRAREEDWARQGPAVVVSDIVKVAIGTTRQETRSDSKLSPLFYVTLNQLA